MDFSLSEELVLLRDSVDKYVSENCTVERHRRLQHSELGFDADAWQQFAELGWLSVPFGEALGGFDAGPAGTMVVAQALGRALVREPYLHTVVTCGNLLQCAGTQAQQAAWIPPIIDGSAQWAFAFAERGSDFDLGQVTTRAVAQGDGFAVSGRKIAVLNGHCADQLLVTALYDGAVGLYVIDATATGVSRERFVAVDGSGGAHLVLDNAAAERLGESPDGQAALATALNHVTVAMGAEALGAMQSLLDATVEYTKTRQQFGQPISRFQVLQHRMADMFMKVEETRSLVLNATILLGQGSAAADAACAALKVKFAEASRFVSQQAIQLHGGIGMTDELVIGHHYKRLLLLGKLYGDEQYHLERFAAAG
ncbi:MAG: acyl-CoA dehydrogenase family protein [Gammaproteobacteria bacterium]|nr:acyl-CoA dehydrogenase family protein [Gammaproteobacteria bacterium]